LYIPQASLYLQVVHIRVCIGRAWSVHKNAYCVLLRETVARCRRTVHGKTDCLLDSTCTTHHRPLQHTRQCKHYHYHIPAICNFCFWDVRFRCVIGETELAREVWQEGRGFLREAKSPKRPSSTHKTPTIPTVAGRQQFAIPNSLSTSESKKPGY
jgi:hypothetical protein